MVETTQAQSTLMTGDSIKINSLSFTNKGDFFTVGTSTGFMVFQTEPYMFLNKTDIEGGVKTVQMLSNDGQKIFVALVGTGAS